MKTRLRGLRPGLLVAVLLSLHAVDSSAQGTVNTVHACAGLSAEPEYRVKTRTRVAPVRFESGAPLEIRTSLPILAQVQSSHAVAARKRRLPDALADGWLTRAVSRDLTTMSLAGGFPATGLRRVQQPGQQKRSWIGRHPVLFGTLVGFGAGFLVGYLPGDDGVFDDFTAEFNGLVLGGVGAGIGALVGAVAMK